MSPAARLRERLDDARLVHVDARVLAHHLLGSAEYAELTRALLAGMAPDGFRGQTSALALYQILAEVYRRGDADLADDVTKLLTVPPALELVPVDAEIAAQAAQVRAQLGGRPERALQIATALVSGADIFLTERSGLRRIVGMSVVNLEDYL